MTSHAKRNWNIPERTSRPGGLRWSILNNGGMFEAPMMLLGVKGTRKTKTLKRHKAYSTPWGIMIFAPDDFYNKHKRYGYR